MDLTSTPIELDTDGAEPPPVDEWESPSELFDGGPVRERIRNVVLQLREPTKVSTVAERADCDPETAREYLEWFAEMGIVRSHEGRPVRYERNESYLRWRRVESIRREYSQREILDRLRETTDELAAYRERFNADSPDAVSLRDATDGDAVERRWEALSEWRGLERRAALLDAARRESGDGPTGVVDV